MVTAAAATQQRDDKKQQQAEDPGWHALELSFNATGEAMLVQATLACCQPLITATPKTLAH